MIPKNSSYKKDTCTDTSSNCIVWEGPDLPCIDLCKGDSITEVVHKFATDYCEFRDSLDLSDFDLKCLFEACQACPTPDKSIKNVFALLRDKICSLEELIENLNPTNVIEPDPFDVNLKCLAVTDGSGNILNDDSQEEQVQAIIDQVCLTKTDLGLLDSEVEDHEIRITALENNSDLDIPTVSSDCLFTGERPVDQAFEILDQDYCELKVVLGTPTDILSAIGKECSFPQLIGNPDFIVNPSNAAESLNNIWLALCNLNARLTANEACCAPTCDDVKVGFSIAFNNDKTATLTFNAGTGTQLPQGWEDCGSTITVSDEQENEITVALTIVNNYTSPDIDLSRFTLGSNLKFGLNLKMCNGEIRCEKCIAEVAQYLGGECCVYTNISTNDVTLIYNTLITNN